MNMLTPLQSASRDWYLEQLGIRQYQLRNPHVLCGEGRIVLSEHTQLIMIGDDLSLETAFMKDVLASISLEPISLVLLKPDQISLLPDNIPCVIWILGSANQPDLTQKSCTLIHTPSLPELIHSATDKRHLWRQLCNYEHYFRS